MRPRFTISLERSTLIFSYPQAGRPITPSFGGKAENICLILSLSGFDRVVGPGADIPSPEQLVAAHIPLAPFQDPDGCETMPCVVLTPGGDYEAPGVHHAGRRRGSSVAARGARAAGGDAGDRISPWGIACRLDGPAAWISSGPEGRGLRRERERGDRVPLGGGAVRSSAGVGSRSDPSSGDRARRHHHSWGTCGEGGNDDDPDRLPRR